MNAPARISRQVDGKIDAINLTALRQDVRRAVATAKIAEFENQAYRLGHIVAAGELDLVTAADILLSVAEGNGLVREQGDDVIQAIMARAVMAEALESRTA